MSVQTPIDETRVAQLPVSAYGDIVQQALKSLIQNFHDCHSNLVNDKYDGFKDFTRDL